jgi:uncharacterized protein (DUF1697 family)
MARRMLADKLNTRLTYGGGPLGAPHELAAGSHSGLAAIHKNMNQYIALLRGINVGVSRSLKMNELKVIFENHGCKEVKTYIQSGNVLFLTELRELTVLAKSIGTDIEKKHGYNPKIQILSRNELENAIHNNPYRKEKNNLLFLHIGFLESTPINPDYKKLDEIKKESELYKIVGKIFYLYAPEGVGKSRLATQAEKIIGVSMTDRNWRTVTKLAEMIEN